MRIESIKDSKRLAPGQLWLAHRRVHGRVRSTTTLLISKMDDDFTWIVMRTNDAGRCFIHRPAVFFLGNELDDDDEDVTFVRLA